MKGPTLAEIALVLFAPKAESGSRMALTRAFDDFWKARLDFYDQTTPQRWEALVAASGRLHREWQK